MTLRPRVTGRRLIVAAALCCLLAALAFGFASGLLPERVHRVATEAFGTVDPTVLTALAGVVVILYGVFISWIPTTGSDANEFAAVDHKSADRDVRQFGIGSLAASSDFGDGNRVIDDPDDPVRQSLRTVLVNMYERETGDEDAARRRVDRGAWTDDRHAAAFLSTTDAVPYPLSHRAYHWLYPDAAYQYRVGRALQAVERECERELTDFEAPVLSPSRLSHFREGLRSLFEKVTIT